MAVVCGRKVRTDKGRRRRGERGLLRKKRDGPHDLGAEEDQYPLRDEKITTEYERRKNQSGKLV